MQPVDTSHLSKLKEEKKTEEPVQTVLKEPTPSVKKPEKVDEDQWKEV